MDEDSATDLLFRKFQLQKFDIKRMVPAVTMTVDADVTAIMRQRGVRNERRAKSQHVTVTHLINKITCDTLADFPLLYASFNGKRLIPNPELVLNMPVDVENHVEYVVVRRPNLLSLDEFIAESASELEKIKAGEGTFRRYVEKIMRIPAFARKIFIRLPGRDVSFLRRRYGNFAVSNFGSFGVDRGAVAISRPMVAAMCFGTVAQRSRPAEAGSSILAQILSLTITFDHRAVDGGYVGRFLTALRRRLAVPGQAFGQ